MTKFVDLARKRPGIFIDTPTQGLPLYSRSTAAGGTGLWGESNNGTGVLGFSTSGPGISGHSVSGTGVHGSSNSGYAGNFDGDVQVLGELTREYSPGTTNRAGPIAYAYVYASGTAVSGTPNLTSTYNSEASRYEITIADEFYINYNYVAVVTPAYSVTPSGAGSPIIPRTYSGGAKLVVYLYNLSGALVTSDFQVVVYKP
jgi:hypothetical protein